ncbi:MAG TPA: VOC family protein [Conexibacter sp.]|nr:VOC family protein [Conexibacter sp.]
MFARVELRAEDLTTSRRFYATVLGALPIGPTARDADGRATAWEDFVLAQADDRHVPTRRLHIGFAAPSRAAVDAFWQAGVHAGHHDDGPPGPRPQYLPDYYGAFLLDPDGNSVEAAHYDGVRDDGAVDHLWIRVGDLAVARAWYEALAPVAGWRLRGADEEQVHFGGDGPGGSFALVSDGHPRTERAHLAVVAADRASVGVRHDPDGNRVELL